MRGDVLPDERHQGHVVDVVFRPCVISPARLCIHAPGHCGDEDVGAVEDRLDLVGGVVRRAVGQQRDGRIGPALASAVQPDQQRSLRRSAPWGHTTRS